MKTSWSERITELMDAFEDKDMPHASGKYLGDTRERKKHRVNLKMAKDVSELSTCAFANVGAVLVKPDGNRIISTGYNGTLSGVPHCEDVNKNMSREEHKKWSSENEVHAELGAILNAAKNGQSTQGTYLYCTLAPCENCAKHLVAAGVKKVFFSEYYWRQGETLFHSNLIEYERIVTNE